MSQHNVYLHMINLSLDVIDPYGTILCRYQ